jgi:hypothetical protein
MSINSIKAEICQLLNLSSISASEAKVLPQAATISGNWSKTETWQQLLNNIKSALEASVTDEAVVKDECITEVSKAPTILLEPNYTADSFIDFILSNKLWFYRTYQVTDIKFPANNKALLYSELLQDVFIITKTSNYEVAFKSVNQVMEDVRELFTFDWVNLANYFFSLKEQQVLTDKQLETGKVAYKSIQLPRETNKANQLILGIANFKQQNTGNYSSKSIKTFKDWVRVIYLEFPERHLEDFLTGLRRNYSRQVIESVREAFSKSDKVTGKFERKIKLFDDPHVDIKGRSHNKKAVVLTRVDERVIPVTDVYVQIKLGELFKLLDIEVDMSGYTRYAAFCGYWKLVVISHILKRTSFNISNDWMRIVAGGLRLNADNFGSYVLVEEIDSRRLNNKIRMTNDTTFKVANDSSGKKPSQYMEANKIKVIERVEVKHSNMLGSSGRPKSVKNTNKGGKGANYIKLAETNNYELRLFYLESNNKAKPHSSFKDVLANIVYVERQTSIATEVGQIWIKSARSNVDILTFYSPRVTKLNSGFMTDDLERKMLSFKRHIEKLSSKIKELRKQREDNKTQQFHLLNERVITDDNGLAVTVVKEEDIAKELRGLIDEKVKYEQQIAAYDLGLPHEIVLALHELGIILTSGCRIEPRQLDWTRIFTTLELEIPLLKNNPIVVKRSKHESPSISKTN